MLFSRMSHTFLPQQLLQEVILVNLLVSGSLNLICYAVIKLSFRTSCLQIHGVLWFPSYSPTLPISHMQIVKLMLVGPPVWIKICSLSFWADQFLQTTLIWNICQGFQIPGNLSAQLLNGGPFQETSFSRNQSLTRIRIFAFITWVKSSVLLSFLLLTREHVK